MFRLYKYLNILSIDVALGAVCCALWFASIFETTLKPQALIVLGLTVWMIYTTDHLLDAKRMKGPASTERHRYHQQYFSRLLIILFVVAAADLLFVFFIRKTVFQWGLILSGTMVVYFLLQQHLKYVKELIVALLFSCGVLLPAWAVSQKPIDLSLMLIISQFMLTALLNLLLFSWFDRHKDMQDRRESFVTLAGETKARRILELVFLLNTVFMVLAIIYMPDQAVILLLMNATLIFMFVRPQYFQKHDRFRIVGDGVFLIPILYWLL
jgi:4-hydroxybenzoate polyprenyltransferase